MNHTEHYYTKSPKSELKYYSIESQVLGKRISMTTCSGVYSPHKLDKGSIFQLQKSRIRKDDSVLDLGCGYGTVGILIKKIYPETDVWMTDINERAVECARKNARKNKIYAKIVQGDGFENIKKTDFDTVLFNPPVNAGLKVCYKLIAGSFDHLKIGGMLQVVVRLREGGESIVNKMKSIFGNAEKVCKSGIYSIYISKKKRKEPVNEYDLKMFQKRNS